jgi:hypothetical protein
MKNIKTRKYGATYKKIRKIVLAQKPKCFYCKKALATTLDHDPPIDSFPAPELWVGTLRPACAKCNYSRGAIYGNKKRKAIKNSKAW